MLLIPRWKLFCNAWTFMCLFGKPLKQMANTFFIWSSYKVCPQTFKHDAEVCYHYVIARKMDSVARKTSFFCSCLCRIFFVLIWKPIIFYKSIPFLPEQSRSAIVYYCVSEDQQVYRLLYRTEQNRKLFHITWTSHVHRYTFKTDNI